MQIEERNNETKRRRRKTINCLRERLQLFKYVIDHENVRFFVLISF